MEFHVRTALRPGRKPGRRFARSLFSVLLTIAVVQVAHATPGLQAEGSRPEPPVLRSAEVRDLGTRIDGEVSLSPEKPYTVLVFTADTCGEGGELTPFGSVDLVTDASGFASFNLVKEGWLNDTLKAVARVTDATGDSSALSACLPMEIALTYWEDVALTLAADLTNAVVGTPVVFSVRLTNTSQTPTGPPEITSLTVDLVLPAGVEFVEASAGGVLTDGRVVFSDVTVPATGGGPELTVTVVPSSLEPLAVEAHVNHLGPYAANNTAALAVAVSGPVSEQADLALTLAAAPEPVHAGGELTYTLTVTNRGPAAVPAVRVSDLLPAGVAFLRASATQGAPVTANGELTCDLGLMTNGARAVVTVVVQPAAEGSVTNVATVGFTPPSPGLMLTNPVPAVVDPVLTNNTGSVVSTVVPPLAVQVAEDPKFNPQTGLYEQVVRFTNIGSNALAGVRLTLSGVAAGVTLLNGSDPTGAQPYLQLHRQVNAGETVAFTVEFYQRDRTGFGSPVYAATEVAEAAPGATGTEVPVTTGRAPLVLGGTLNNGRFLLEFRAVPGQHYAVQYRNTVGDPWRTAVPTVTAPANVVQWLDDGPPKTVTRPPAASRFYRVLLLEP